MKALGILELAAFATIAAFLAWLQVDIYRLGAFLREQVSGREAVIYRLVGLPAAFGWFLLIILYGAFIPNTLRRYATVLMSMAVIPVVLMVAYSRFDRTVGTYLLAALPETLILMATAAAIAVFGAHKIRELHRVAHEARRIGQYRLKRVLGQGGMGTVCLAEHVLLRRRCAIKMIRAAQVGDSKILRRFEQEVQATATLTHWNTIDVYDYGHTEDGLFYYVMNTCAE